MKVIDVLSRAVGVLFLVMAGVLVFRPGGAGRVAITDYLESRSVARTLRENWTTIAATKYRLGAGNVRLVELVDYQCFFCRRFHHEEESLMKLVPGTAVGIVHVPRPGDEVSRTAALTAICAANEGKFAEMHRLLMTDTVWARTRDWDRLATTAGPQVQRFQACLTSSAAAAALARDVAWSERLKIRGTPVLLTRRGGAHLGAVSAAEAAAWISGQD